MLSKLVAVGRYQIACAVALAEFGGARKSELTRFKVCYFDNANIIHDSLYRTPEKIRTKGRGVKGKSLYKFVLANRFKPYFELWRAARERLGIDSEWLFVAKTSGGYEQAKPSTLNAWVDVNSKNSGFRFVSTVVAQDGLKIFQLGTAPPAVSPHRSGPTGRLRFHKSRKLILRQADYIRPNLLEAFGVGKRSKGSQVRHPLSLHCVVTIGLRHNRELIAKSIHYFDEGLPRRVTVFAKAGI